MPPERAPCPRCGRALRLAPNANLVLCGGCGYPHDFARPGAAPQLEEPEPPPRDDFPRCPDCACVLDFKAGVLLCHACGYAECG